MPETFVAAQTYHIAAPPARVFRFLVEPKLLVKWFLSEARLAPRSGGAFSFDWIGGYHMESRLRTYRAGSAVSFRWMDKLPDGRLVETSAAFRVRRKGRGTLLELRHSGFTVPEHFAECSSRWAYYLMNLKSVVEHDQDLRSSFDW